MGRANRRSEKREELVAILAGTFAELGYRRTTTAELAARCGVRENILYRLWPDKREMFLAAIDWVYALSERTWQGLLAEVEPAASPAELLLEYEATHQGEFGLYRIVFAGLSETDDPAIAAAMKRLYRRFQRFVAKQVEAHRAGAPRRAPRSEASLDPALTAWALIGLGTMSNVGRELGLLGAPARRRLLAEGGRTLLG